MPEHRFSLHTVRRIDRFTQLCGHAIAWLLLFMVAIESLVVILRYGMDLGSIAAQEAVTYLHATVFLLGAGYTLQRDEHVRVDIFYRRFTARRKAWVNLFGYLLFLLPVCCYIIWESWAYVAQAWSIKETSADSGGIAGVYLLKTLIPLFALLLIVQGLAEALRSWLVLRGQPWPPAEAAPGGSTSM
ncbi:MAG: TRAP transporter small permease subunit [Gammaproteobacteria bacterium]|nr:TRAP transporter small permease subunit [Gammaproteobacteria bacterium]